MLPGTPVSATWALRWYSRLHQMWHSPSFTKSDTNCNVHCSEVVVQTTLLCGQLDFDTGFVLFLPGLWPL